MAISRKALDKGPAKTPQPAKKVGDVLSPDQIQKDMLEHARRSPYSGGLHSLDLEAAMKAHKERRQIPEKQEVRSPQEMADEQKRFADAHPEAAARLELRKVLGAQVEESREKTRRRVKYLTIAGTVLAAIIGFKALMSPIGSHISPELQLKASEQIFVAQDKINKTTGKESPETEETIIRIRLSESLMAENKELAKKLSAELDAKHLETAVLRLPPYSNVTLGEAFEKYMTYQKQWCDEHGVAIWDPGQLRGMYHAHLGITPADYGTTIGEFLKIATDQQKVYLYFNYINQRWAPPHE